MPCDEDTGLSFLFNSQKHASGERQQDRKNYMGKSVWILFFSGVWHHLNWGTGSDTSEELLSPSFGRRVALRQTGVYFTVSHIRQENVSFPLLLMADKLLVKRNASIQIWNNSNVMWLLQYQWCRLYSMFGVMNINDELTRVQKEVWVITDWFKMTLGQ